MKIFFILIVFFLGCSNQQDAAIPEPAMPVVKFFEAMNHADSSQMEELLSEAVKKNLYHGSQMTAEAFRDSMKNMHLEPTIKKVVMSEPDVAKVYFALTETNKNKTVDSLYFYTTKETNGWKLASMWFFDDRVK